MRKQMSEHLGVAAAVAMLCLLVGGVYCSVYDGVVFASNGGHAGYAMWSRRLFVSALVAFVVSVVCFVIARARRSRPSEP